MFFYGTAHNINVVPKTFLSKLRSKSGGEGQDSLPCNRSPTAANSCYVDSTDSFPLCGTEGTIGYNTYLRCPLVVWYD